MADHDHEVAPGVPVLGVPDAKTIAARAALLVPESNVWHIGDAVRGWAERAVIRHAAGERYGWDVSLVTVPTPAGLMGMYAVILYAPSPILGQPALGAVQMLADCPDQPMIEQAVSAAVETLRQRRSALITGGNGRPVRDSPQA